MTSLPRFHVYLLWSAKTNQVYCGSTGNLRRRFKRHNASDNTGWTKRGQPWRLLAVRCFLDRQSALMAERAIKRVRGAKSDWIASLPRLRRLKTLS